MPEHSPEAAVQVPEPSAPDIRPVPVALLLPRDTVTVTVSRGSQSATGTGRMSGSDAGGRWATASGECSGTWSAERRS
jgi:hypothetical protein